MVIQDPHLDGDALSYSIKLLDGAMPAATGPCALFIDPLGRPFVTGLRRRDAPAGAPPGTLRTRRLAAVRGSVPLTEATFADALCPVRLVPRASGPASRPNSVRAFGGMPAAASCGQSTFWPDASPKQSAAWRCAGSSRASWKTAVAGWFGRFPARVESREDTYLLDPQLRGLSVKVRGGGALEVKVYRGSPGILEVAGRARGRLEAWQKWSFPFSPLRPHSGDPAGWRPVRKRRRITRFSLASGPIVAPAPGLGGEPQCEVELTEVRTRGQDWWTLGFEATGPPEPAPQRTRGRRRAVCSPRPCPVTWNPARMNPGPTRNGCAWSLAADGDSGRISGGHVLVSIASRRQVLGSGAVRLGAAGPSLGNWP